MTSPTLSTCSGTPPSPCATASARNCTASKPSPPSAARPGGSPGRVLHRTEITTFGTDFATANTEFQRANATRIGRQSQTWVRFPEGWRITAAHVSLTGD